jgi:predicted  nucleic acid-binding Zn-ribbon protein
VTVKKVELMRALQHKLATVGRTDDKLDHELTTLEAQVAEWMKAEEANKPKGKRTQALNVMRT